MFLFLRPVLKEYALESAVSFNFCIMYTDHSEDTIFAPATIPGTGAISVIRISGPEAIPAAAALVHPVASADISDESRRSNGDFKCEASCACPNQQIIESKGYRMHFGQISGKDGRLLDEVIASVFRAPHSYTGEDSVEISCHASSYIVSEISALLVDLGLRPAEPGEFTQRAFFNGKMDLAQAEAVADVIAAQSAASHRIAVNQLKGGFSSELKTMRASLLEIVSLMELELDFSDEDVEFADRGRLNSLVDGVMAHIRRLMDSFRAGNAIKNGVPVALVGATNVGKSTLLNALLGEERAIVSDIHGTTRDTVEETMNLGGVLFRFIDTAGLRETVETVEKIGIERSYKKLHEAQIVLGVVDASRVFEENCREIREILSHTDPDRQDIIIVLNKCDALVGTDCESVGYAASGMDSGIGTVLRNKNVICINKYVSFIDNDKIKVVAISAREKAGIDGLKSLLSDTQKDLTENTDAVLVTNIRHLEALSSASTALGRVKSGLSYGTATDLVSQDLREALYHLGSILGEISTDEVLGNIFKNFCISPREYFQEFLHREIANYLIIGIYNYKQSKILTKNDLNMAK